MQIFADDRERIRRAAGLWSVSALTEELDDELRKNLVAFGKKTVRSWEDWSFDEFRAPYMFFPHAWGRNKGTVPLWFELKCWGDPQNRSWLACAAGLRGLSLAYVLDLHRNVLTRALFAWRIARILEEQAEELSPASMRLCPWDPEAMRLVIPVRTVPLEELAGAHMDWLSVMREPLTEALGTVRKVARACDGPCGKLTLF